MTDGGDDVGTDGDEVTGVDEIETLPDFGLLLEQAERIAAAATTAYR